MKRMFGVYRRIAYIIISAICLVLLYTNPITAQVAAPVKAAWVTNVGSDVLLSRENIREAVQLAKQSGLNTLCVVTWNNGYTMFQSSTLKQYFGVAIDPVYGNRDPLQEFIEEAHAAGIRVIAWFEFGFAAAYGDGGKHILQKYPHWAAKDHDGNFLVENGFTWMNSFHPEVQHFLTQMILEVVQRYDVNGVQGDDRLPAAPIRGGYDSLTTRFYRQDHQGNSPPYDYHDTAWTNWRAGRMNEYGRNLYQKVKTIRPTVIVAHAPSIYPWSKEHYLQDWPAWLREGYTDLVMPQVYRYTIEAYKATLDELIKQVGEHNLDKVFPGILTSLADGFLVKDELVRAFIAYNRSKGIRGEAFFYFEGLRRSPEFYRHIYPTLN